MKTILLIAGLLVPAAFTGGYLLATVEAENTCQLQVEREPGSGIASVCADIGNSGVTNALFFGAAGLVLFLGLAYEVGRRLDR
jgi:hypothetical protein